MSYVAQLDAHADWLERKADQSDAREAARADAYREAWDDIIKQRSIDADTGMKYMPKLIDVFSEATCQNDDSIYRSLMQALVHCAAKGQIEAIEALDKVKSYFIAWCVESDK